MGGGRRWDDGEDDAALPPSLYDQEEPPPEPLDPDEETPLSRPAALHRPVPQTTDILGAHTLPLLEATSALVRLDERLSAAPAPVRAGWLARAVLAEAAASLVLDGGSADAQTLRLADADVYRAGWNEERAEAATVLHLLRSGARRSVRHMFSSRRLLALLRLPKRFRKAGDYIPDWPALAEEDNRRLIAALDSLLTEETVAAWNTLPPLLGAAAILTAWYNSEAGMLIGGAPGRVLASAWLRRQGLLSGAWFLPAQGFRGARSDWTPGSGASWPGRFLAAARRSAGWGLDLHRNLLAAHAELHQLCAGQRKTSMLPRLADALLEKPTLTAATAAATLHISRRGAAGLVAELHARAPALVRELTGGAAFRLYGVL